MRSWQMRTKCGPKEWVGTRFIGGGRCRCKRWRAILDEQNAMGWPLLHSEVSFSLCELELLSGSISCMARRWITLSVITFVSYFCCGDLNAAGRALQGLGLGYLRLTIQQMIAIKIAIKPRIASMAHLLSDGLFWACIEFVVGSACARMENIMNRKTYMQDIRFEHI